MAHEKIPGWAGSPDRFISLPKKNLNDHHADADTFHFLCFC